MKACASFGFACGELELAYYFAFFVLVWKETRACKADAVSKTDSLIQKSAQKSLIPYRS